MSAAFTFETARRIVCADGAASTLGAVARGLGVTRALVVTDRGLLAGGALGPALAGLAAAGVEAILFADVEPDPPEACVEADLPRLARDAMRVERLLVNNPRPVTYDDALAIYRRAL